MKQAWILVSITQCSVPLLYFMNSECTCFLDCRKYLVIGIAMVFVFSPYTGLYPSLFVYASYMYKEVSS